MKLNSLMNNLKPDDFFGIKSSEKMQDFGMENLIYLIAGMKQKINFADLGHVNINNFSELLSRNKEQLEEFKKTKLAKLTLTGDIFKHSNGDKSLNTHTIGLVINQSPNTYFYKSRPQVIILDSLGNKKKELKTIHEKLINEFIKKEFPEAEVLINTKPQQNDRSLSCLNWTLENLNVANKNLGKTNIIELLPQSKDIDKILEKQKIISQNGRKH